MTLKTKKQASYGGHMHIISTWEVEAGGLEFKGQSQLYS